MAVVNGVGSLTPMGTQAIASWIYDKLRSGLFKLGIYNGNTKIKTIDFTATLSGSQIIIEGKDETADEYDFNRVTIETTGGVVYFNVYSELKHKAPGEKMTVDIVLPVLQTPTTGGGTVGYVSV